MNFREKIATFLPEKGAGGSQAVWKFSGNSSISEKTGFPNQTEVHEQTDQTLDVLQDESTARRKEWACYNFNLTVSGS